MPHLSHVAGLSLLLLPGCARLDGVLDVDLSGEVPVFDLIDHAGRTPDTFIVRSCHGDGDAESATELWTVALEGLDDWPITYGDPALGGAAPPLEDGVQYDAVAWHTTGSGADGADWSGESGAGWRVSFRIDTQEVSPNSCD